MLIEELREIVVLRYHGHWSGRRARRRKDFSVAGTNEPEFVDDMACVGPVL